MTDDLETAFRGYIEAFERLDPERVLSFYDLPSIFIAPAGVFAVPDAKTARALLSRFMDELRVQSYRRTQVLGLTARRLSPGLGSCSGTFVRFDTSDGEIARAGFTYIMRDSGSWRIVVAVVHDPVAA